MDTLTHVLGWCTLINWAMLFIWFLMLVLAHDWIYRLHSKWFKISVEQFDATHYGGIILFKVGVFMFNLVPYLALRIVV